MEYAESIVMSFRILISPVTTLLLGIPHDSSEDVHSSLSHYIYNPLPSTSSFRVLELLPGQGHDEIAFHLHIVDWNNPPPYEAISYAWGTDSKIPTLCSSRLLLITPNLKDGLRRMRYPSRSRLLWADAACVDQSNTNERSHQVSNMQKIYQLASQVVVWLGEDEDGHAQTAVEAMHEIAAVCCANSSMTIPQLREFDGLWAFTTDYFEDLQCDTTRSRDSISWFLTRPWFTRLWVFQEVNLGSSRVSVLCGTSEVSWDIVSIGSAYMRSHSAVYLPWVFPHSNCQQAYIMGNRKSHKQITLPRLLHWGRNFSTSDPLDRVYALMGMPHFTNMRTWEADYRKSRLELYQEVAKRCIDELDGLDVLSFVQHVEEVHGPFPSWVPQWDQEILKHATNSPKFNWRACEETVVSAQVLSSFLKIEGIVFDTMTQESKMDTWFDSGNSAPVLEFWKSQKECPTTYPTGETSIEAYAIVLTGGVDWELNKAVENRAPFLAYFAAYILRHLQLANISGTKQISELKKQASSEKWYKYEWRARIQSLNRSLVRTNRGYMGLGPNAVQVGDIVCIFFGGYVPYILRPMNGYYQFVGDCYIHGIMEGEALKMRRAGDLGLEKRVFEIH